MKRFKRFGPFRYFRVKTGSKHFISAWLSGYESAPWGWEWGTDDMASNPSYCLRIGHFNVFSYESFPNGGPTIAFFGFWWSL